jgi:hypothetical protein
MRPFVLPSDPREELPLLEEELLVVVVLEVVEVVPSSKCVYP